MMIIEVICMPSRMERYYKSGSKTPNRSERNERLYRDIYDHAAYSNIEGVAHLNRTNEVDITKIKNMLKNREQYQQQKELRNIVTTKVQEKEPEVSILDEEKNYDIRDILNKAKVNRPTDNQYHRLEDTEYFKKLKQEKENPKDLRDMIDTIQNTSLYNQMEDKELSLDMFEDLKSENNTIIESKDAIQSLLEEAKKEEQKKQEEKIEMDHSFYTSSLGFAEDDFEQIADLNHNIKKNNFWIKTLVFLLLIVVAVFIIIGIYMLMK